MFTGVDAVIFGTDDFENSQRFLNDFGLSEADSNAQYLRFVSTDQSELFIYKPDHASLPPANAQAPTLREVIWGVVDQSALDALAERLGAEATTDFEGRLAVLDPDGLMHAFRISQRTNVAAKPQLVNAPGRINRVDRRSPVYKTAKPIGIGHVVVYANDFEVTANFFKEKLGFVESDRFNNFAIFLRASTPGPHHHLFIQNRPQSPGVDHVSFTVNSTLEVLGGGLHMERQAWNSFLGPGFHPVSSAFYWYFKTPFGPRLEYYVDDDYCTEAWQAQAFDLSPKLYVEWAVNGFHKNGTGQKPV